MPPGGAWDPSVQRALNLAVGNAVDDAVLELAMCQFTLSVQEPLDLAWGGAPITASVNGRTCNENLVTLQAGDTLQLDAPKVGARVWVAIRGGFIGSGESHLTRGAILQRGPDSGQMGSVLQPIDGAIASELRTVPGRAEFAQLFENTYHVRHDSNRVGIRLDGPKMAHKLELPSEPAVSGVIQITTEGLPIILGPDGPTIGGYPRAGVVVTEDLPKLAQLRPGDSVRFSAMSN